MSQNMTFARAASAKPKRKDLPARKPIKGGLVAAKNK